MLDTKDYGDYITMKDGQITEVRCKGCGGVIRAMIPDGSMGVVERVNGQTIVRERLSLACLPNYREAMIQLSDGSKHVTCLCNICVEKLSDPDMAREVYAKDLAQFQKEGAVFSPAQKARTMTAVLKIAPQIGV